jgi:hypothetical protein
MTVGGHGTRTSGKFGGERILKSTFEMDQMSRRLRRCTPLWSQ